jgi:hypothetical protein
LIFKNILDKLRNYDGNLMSYGILPSCRRCVYGKSHEPLLIFSKDRGPRIIVNLDSNTYVRHKDCLGFSNCGKCFEAVTYSDSTLPCIWAKL